VKTVGPFRLGITGGIGCGKSTVGSILAQRGWHVIDTDEIARNLLQSDAGTIAEILSVWPGVRMADGSINRKALADIVFADSDALRRLNGITHPKIGRIWLAQADAAVEAGLSTAVIIPLLHEVGAAREFDAVVCVGCTCRTQMERLKQRGWSVEQGLARIKSQLPMQKKIELSDFLLWNEQGAAPVVMQINILESKIGIRAESCL